MLLGNLKTCPVCGQIFDISFYTDYAYRKSIHGKTILFCGYSCMRTVEKQLEAEEKAKKVKKNDN